MKLSNLIMLFLAGISTITNAAAQANASINILTQNTGIVSQGSTVFLEITINNTGPVSSIGAYKIKTQIGVPSAITSIPATGHNLPAGWTITSNDGTTIRLSNGTDIIAVNDSRNILIAIQGNTPGGPSTVAGQLSFSNGSAPGTAPGTLAGDNSADNSSTSTVQVTNPTPVALKDFSAALVNCAPVLNWITETETNSDRFEIERSDMNSSGWVLVGVVAANGNTPGSEYNLTDRHLNDFSEKVLYRLKIIDKDGYYKYSKVLPVFVNCKTTHVNVYPNPVQNGTLYISLNGIHGYTVATLITMSGQVILKSNMKNGINKVNISNIADGLYILNIRDASGVHKKVKVLVQHLVNPG